MAHYKNQHYSQLHGHGLIPQLPEKQSHIPFVMAKQIQDILSHASTGQLFHPVKTFPHHQAYPSAVALNSVELVCSIGRAIARISVSIDSTSHLIFSHNEVNEEEFTGGF